MGVSTNAILYYGFELYNTDEGEGCLPESLIDEWENEEELSLEEFLEEKFPDVFPSEEVTLGYHCHSEYSMWYIALTKKANGEGTSLSSLFYEARRGYPVDIDNCVIANTTLEDRQKLEAVAVALGISLSDVKIGWRLASTWI